MSSTNYEILENTTDWVVVRLTATPTDDIMEEIASINSAIYPILVTSLDFEAARKISADNRGVITADNMAFYGSETFVATNEGNAIRWLKAKIG
jgi:hypothetical protein